MDERERIGDDEATSSRENVRGWECRQWKDQRCLRGGSGEGAPLKGIDVLNRVN